MLSFVELSKSSSLVPRLSPNVTQATQVAESWAGPGKRLPVQYITVCYSILQDITVNTFLTYFSISSVYLSISQIPQKNFLSQYILVYTPQYFLSILQYTSGFLCHTLPLPPLPSSPHTHSPGWLPRQQCTV